MLRVFDGGGLAPSRCESRADDPDVANNRPAYGTQIAIGDLDKRRRTTHGHPRSSPSIASDTTTRKIPSPSSRRHRLVGSLAELVGDGLGRICSGTEAPTFRYSSQKTEPTSVPRIWDIDDDGIPRSSSTPWLQQPGVPFESSVSFTPYVDHGRDLHDRGRRSRRPIHVRPAASRDQ